MPFWNLKTTRRRIALRGTLLAIGLLVVLIFAVPTAMTTSLARLVDSQNGPAEYIIPDGLHTVDGNGNYSHVRPGDRLLIPAGRRDSVRFVNLQGEPGNRIVITNYGGQAEIDTDEWVAISLENCQHIRLTGTGDPGIEYGFDLHGFTNAGLFAWMGTEYVEIDHLRIHHSSGESGVGIRAYSYKDDVGDDWIQHDTYIHHVYVHDVGMEGFYVGTSDTYDGTPLHDLEIAYCRIERTGLDGIQIRHAIKGCEIHHNYAKDIGLRAAESPDQACAALLAGSETGGRWYGNIVVNAEIGIQLADSGEDAAVFCNLFAHSGYFRDGDGIQQGVADVAFIHHNTVVDSYRDGIHVTSKATQGEVRDNIVAESGQEHINADVLAHHNIEADSIEEIGFVDPDSGNYDLRERSLAKGAGSDGGDVGAFPCELDWLVLPLVLRSR